MGTMRGFGAAPYRAICAVLAAVAIAFGVCVAVGWVEVRRPDRGSAVPVGKRGAVTAPSAGTPAGPYVHRVKAAEALAWEQKPIAVYRFAGGVPDCWAEIDSEGNRRTLGPWRATESLLFAGADPLDRPIPESVEGYIALFGPTTAEQTYRLMVGVTKIQNEVRVTFRRRRPRRRRSVRRRRPCPTRTASYHSSTARI